ncbi:MAG: aspartate-semialdehyde dehydrogenase [Nitrospirota bacterium]|nr:MAG: aspartate-semialdehyde dehydrogenase [Nitrospirota bacterium]
MFKKKDMYTVAVVGATGAVGNEMVSILDERDFPVSELKAYASERSIGKKIDYKGSEIPVNGLTESAFNEVDIALFSAGSDSSRQWAPVAASNGCVVIDNSSAWRMDPEVPLIVPEVNYEEILKHKGIISNPNCSTIQMVVPLKAIYDEVGIERIVVSTYQSVSGSGQKGVNELSEQVTDLLNLRDVNAGVYPHQIAFNCLPHIDEFLESGYTKEEMKMVNETKRILGDDSIGITATAVRVPVFMCHSESVNIETKSRISANEVRALLSSCAGVTVFDAPERDVYPMAIDASGRDDIYVGRIREDDSVDNGINMWIVADNLRKGAALNAVQIAEHLIDLT